MQRAAVACHTPWGAQLGCRASQAPPPCAEEPAPWLAWVGVAVGVERCCLAAAGAVLQHEKQVDAPVAAAVVAAVVAAVAAAAVVPVMTAVVHVMAAAVCAAAEVVVTAAVVVLGPAPALPTVSGCEAELDAAAQEGREQRRPWSVLGPLDAQYCWLLHVEMVAAPDEQSAHSVQAWVTLPCAQPAKQECRAEMSRLYSELCSNHPRICSLDHPVTPHGHISSLTISDSNRSHCSDSLRAALFGLFIARHKLWFMDCNRVLICSYMQRVELARLWQGIKRTTVAG